MQDTKLIRRTLIRYGTTQCKLPYRPGGLFYPLILLRLVYLLYKLPNRPDGLPHSDTFTACSIAKHRIGQTDSRTLWYFDGPTIRNQLGLGGDYRHGLYTTKVSGGVGSTRLVGLIYSYHSNSCLKAIARQGLVGMMTSLTRIIWYWYNEVDRRKTCNEARKVGRWSSRIGREKVKLTGLDHVQPVIYRSRDHNIT